jgi:MFS family permease
MGWTNPWIITGLIAGVVLLIIFLVVESRVSEPMFQLRLFRNIAFSSGNAASFLIAVARGGLQFMLIIWLQGIWLPLHGYNYSDTPLWAGIYLVPLTVGFLVSGPVSGRLSDKFGQREFAVAGLLLMAASFGGMLALPTNFSYPVFAILIFLNGVGGGLFSAPNTSMIMSSVGPEMRGAASGMRATFMNAGSLFSIGVFFSLMVIGLASTLPHTIVSQLTAQNVPASVAQQVSALPPVGLLFAAFLGYNPMQQLLGAKTLAALPPKNAATLTGHSFFPNLISGPFHHGLMIVFWLAIGMSLVGAAASFAKPRPAA